MDLAQYPEFSGFFEEAAKGRLAFPFCRHCSRYHWYPLPLCPYCSHDAIEWVPVTGGATLYSWTEVRRAFSEETAGAVPYVIAVVAFAESSDIRFVTQLRGVAAKEVHIGMALKPVFPSADDPSKLIYFYPA